MKGKRALDDIYSQHHKVNDGGDKKYNVKLAGFKKIIAVSLKNI
jgi:hypothetical protein